MNRPTLSLCLIVRDEAELLPGCLASVRGVVDQIVVLDTGSQDETVAIAQRAGAVVVHHPWRSDFADARNAALAHATGDWILVLDADERLAPGAGRALHDALAIGNFALGFLPLHNADRLDATPTEILGGQARRGEPVLLPRLLRRTPDLAWEGVIHENVDRWFGLDRARRAIRVDADILHLGAVPSVQDKRDKVRRNLALLERACGLAPQDPMRRAWLARELLRVGEPLRARAEAEAAWSCCRAALAAGVRTAVTMPATLAAFLRLEDGNLGGVLEVVREARTHAEDHPNLDILLAVALLQRGDPADLDEAEAALRRCLRHDGSLFTTEIMPGATRWAAQTQLGVLHLLRDRPAEALGHFSEALTTNPHHLHARLGAGEALIALERPDQALRVLEPVLADGGADGWILAADAALRLRHFDDARALLSRGCADAAPSDPRRALRRAQVHTALEAQHLLVALTDGPPVTPPQPTAHLLAEGEDRFARGDLDGAVDRFVRALSLEPGSADAWTNLGVGLHAADLSGPALRALRMAIRLDPRHREALLSLANISAEQGRPDEAAESFRRLLDHHPGDPIALESLQLMGLQGAVAADPTPLLSVLLYGSADPSAVQDALDRLALQDLHPSLYEVLLLAPAAPTEIRPFGLRTLPGASLEDALEAARGRWAVILRTTDLPARELLRRHLAGQVQSPRPCILQGARGFAESRRSEPLVAALSSVNLPGAPLSNLSLPQDRADLLADLRWRPDSADLDTVLREDLRCWRGEPVSLDALLDAQRAIGAAARRAWEADIATPLPDLPGAPGREESWLGLRLLVEHHDEATRKARTTIEGALRRGDTPIDPGALSLLLQQARRQGMIEASLAHHPVPTSPLSSALTSIIIPNLNGMPHLIPCIESLRRHTRGPVELIVVDNGSTDGSLAWLRAQRDVHLMEMGQNIGAPAARNRGLAAARGETILFCDNDVVFTPGWRPALLAHLERWPDIGMVGPMSDYVTGHQKLNEHPPRQAPLSELDAFAEEFHRQRKGQHTYSHRLILFFLLARRSVFETIGGIDEGYGRWGFEDDDLCLRVGLAGYRMRIAADCFIRHLGSQTAASANLDYDRLLLQNWEVFKSKWGLDPSLPYGPYDPAQILAQRFAPEHIFVPFRSDSAPPPADPIKLIDMR